MKTLMVSVVFALLFVISGHAQTVCTRHTESAGGFSYCPPPGWVVKDPGSDSFKSFFTPEGAPFRANLNVMEESSTLPNDEYTASALRLMLKENEARNEEARKVIGWTKFTTESNLTGSRLVYQTTYKGSDLRTIQFVFDFPGKKVIITGTALSSTKDTTDKIFDAVAKTLRLIP